MNVDANPYPWPDPVARDLHRRLAEAFYEPSEIRTLVKSAGGPDVLAINFNQPPLRIWSDTLDRAAAQGALRGLLAFVAAQPGTAPELAAFVRDVVAAKQPAVRAALAPDAPPVELTRPEALLFVQDLSESVGDIPGLVAAIERVMQHASAVCRLEVTSRDGLPSLGTGTLLATGRVLTNHHVMVPDGAPAAAVRVQFRVELDAQGQSLPSIALDGDLATLVADAADDWATFALAGATGGDAPGVAGGRLAAIMPFDLAAGVAPPSVKDRAFILQHPDGQPKRLAFVRNQVTEVSERRLRYVTDTQGGSSGSPVFNAAGKLIGLHRAGGIPQKLPGLPPIKANEGVRADAIAAAILGR